MAMVKGRTTRMMGTRVPDEVYLKFEKQAAKMSLTVGERLRGLVYKSLGLPLGRKGPQG